MLKNKSENTDTLLKNLEINPGKLHYQTSITFAVTQ